MEHCPQKYNSVGDYVESNCVLRATRYEPNLKTKTV
jgi:hypothetical protein